jgi:hypothetical protein
MASKHSVTIRMGAAHWDVTLSGSPHNGPDFNLRKMDRNQRGKFHGHFMAAFRRSQQPKGGR